MTITASASSSSRRSAASMRPTLSPTLTCGSEAMPLSGELLADPRRVGVDDLAEQQLGADGEDVTAHGRPRAAGGRAAVRAGTAQPLTTASTTASHRKPFHSHVASTAVSGSRAKPTASCWASVLFLAIRLAGTLTPREPTTVRYMLMTNSRTAMMATGTIQNTPLPTSVNIAPSTSTLSASGSRKAPERVAPWRRAT